MPGLYWFTLVKGAALRHTKVWRQPKGLEHGGKLLVSGADCPVPVERFTERYWAGVLPLPKGFADESVGRFYGQEKKKARR